MRTSVSVSALLFISITCVTAQQPRVSPHDKTSITLDGKKITIEYGRPYMKGRKIMGGLVPYGQVWRTGADEATILSTDADLDVGGLKVPKGTYSVFTIPTESGWKLVINKTAKQWGAFDYDQSKDLGRADMTVSKSSSPVEQFTITLEPKGSNQAILKMAWENTLASVPITVGR